MGLTIGELVTYTRLAMSLTGADTFPQQLSRSVAPHLGMGLMCPIPILDGVMNGVILYKSCAGTPLP